jgi:5-(carboxyamino)imidazole ribonucleotide mutase
MRHADAQLDALAVPTRRGLSAHRMPDDMFEYAEDAAPRGLRAIIAGRGRRRAPARHARRQDDGARARACPCRRSYLRGEDSLLSIVQMPKGIPVATFAIGEAGAANAASSPSRCSRRTDARSRSGCGAARAADGRRARDARAAARP